jgi:alpha-amylase
MRGLLLAAISGLAASRTAAEWKQRSIYQLLTDRFNRGNGDNTICTNLSVFCGGTFKGITDHLDYI